MSEIEITKIGFDAKRAVANMTGLGNYSRFAIEAMARQLPDAELLLYTPRKSNNPRLRVIESQPNTSFISPGLRGVAAALWRSLKLTLDIRRDRLDIFHGLSNELPLNIRQSGIPSVVTIHDLIYRRFPEGYNPIDRKLYDLKYRRSCLMADRIIAISECTKRDIMELYGIDEQKIDVIYQGVDPKFYLPVSDDDIESVRTKYLLPQNYILQVGTIEKRKNLELTIRALAALPKKYRLVVVGKDRLGYLQRCKNLSSELGIGKRILHLQDVDCKHLPALNKAADVVVYPSRYEGFGLPIVEALAASRPVVAATGSCLEEAGGEGAIYVDPDSPAEMAEAILAITSSKEREAHMTETGRRHIEKFSTENFACATLESYQKAILSHRKG